MAARVNPALSTFLDSMFVDATVGSGTVTGQLAATPGTHSAEEPGSGQAQTQEQHNAESTGDFGSGNEETAQIPGSTPCLSHHTTMWPARTNVIGTVIQAYSAHTVQLERQCLELLQENKQLRRGLEADRLQRERLSELNLRLVGELQRTRRELTVASAQAEQLGTELQSARQKRAATAGKLRLARRKAARLGSMVCHEEGCSAALSQPYLTQSAFTELQSEPLLQEQLDQEKISTTEERFPIAELTTMDSPPGLPRLTAPSMFSSTFTSIAQPDHCGDLHDNSCLWGCLQDATYSRSLMLAHHTLHQNISRGPPGLEQAKEDQNSYVASRLVTQRRTGGPHRQPRL